MKLENITDDTRNIKKDSIFLITPQNEKFASSLPQDIKTITREDLKKYFIDTIGISSIQIIGITGTNGKTTTAAAIYSVLLDMGYKVALLGTRGMFINENRVLEKGLTTPSLLDLYKDIALAISRGCSFFIMEVSSHAIKQERIFGLNFALKILTNITSDHLDYHKTWEDYANTKLSFLKADNVDTSNIHNNTCIKVINMDDKSGATLRFMPNVLGYGIESKSNLFVNAYSLNDGIFAHINFRESSKNHNFKDSKVSAQNSPVDIESANLISPLFGLFNLYNLLAATLALKAITRKSLESICAAMTHFGGVAGRMEIVSAKPLVIIDFAHTTDGMLQVFESFKNKKIYVIFGAGGDRDSSKRAKMGACAATFAHRIYITNDNPRSENPHNIAKQILSGAKSSARFNSLECVEVILDRKEAINTALCDILHEEDSKNCVLLILGKGDENTQIFKDKTIHFSDKECVLEILKNYKS